MQSPEVTVAILAQGNNWIMPSRSPFSTFVRWFNSDGWNFIFQHLKEGIEDLKNENRIEGRDRDEGKTLREDSVRKCFQHLFFKFEKMRD